LIAGARPNFMKIAPLHTALGHYPELFATRIVHTGQHYDYKMSQVFFDDLGLPEPDAYLNVGSGSHAEQTAYTLLGVERHLESQRTDLVIVVGDVNSTAAAALAAAKLHIPVAHVEAGLRSNDRRMPEELNRVATDHLADILYTPSRDADTNLRLEGIPDERIVFVGNVMIDTLHSFLPRAAESTITERLGLDPGRYALLTLHRAENVDSREQIDLVADLLERVSRIMPLVFPIHPRAEKNLSSSLSRERWDKIVENTDLRLIDPVGYIDFLRLQRDAHVVLTDSGGIQEETTALGIPCLTLRENTERPVTVTEGTNVVVGLKPEYVAGLLQSNQLPARDSHRIPLGWDGKAASRIVEHLIEFFQFPTQAGTAAPDLEGIGQPLMEISC